MFLEKTGSWNDCYVSAVEKADAHIIDFSLVETSQDLFFVATNKSVWLHRLGGDLMRDQQGVALRSESRRYNDQLVRR